MTEARLCPDHNPEIADRLVALLKDTTSDWDLTLPNGIGVKTQLIRDLCFESIDIVQFVMSIQQEFSCQDLPFERLLMVEGRYVSDLNVAEVAAFLSQYLGKVGWPE
jgi:acyl carrier protein